MRRGSLVLAFVVAGVACGGDDSTGGGAGTGQAAGSASQSSGGSGGTSNAGGSGGSNSAGSTMAGGAAGTSVGSGGTSVSSDGGSKCSVRDPNACDTCVFGKCCDAYAACVMNDDCLNAVGNLAECVANDPSMVTQCYDDFSTTNDMASGLRMCVKTNCDMPCTTVTP
jgi:hypothetical protein